MCTVPNWKPLPRAIEKLRKQKTTSRDDERARNKVRAHWREKCRVCGRRTRVVHEEKRRGAGGPVSLANSYLACDVINGGACHPLLQNRFIYARMANGADEFDAQEDLVFEMTEKIAVIVFDKRARPAHVRIVDGD